MNFNMKNAKKKKKTEKEDEKKGFFAKFMLQGGAEEYAESAPWMAIFPGLAISLAVFGFNLFGDALRDVLDPKLRSQ